MILELVALGGSGYFLYKDSKNGFIKTKTLVEKVSGGRIKLLETSVSQSRVQKAETAVTKSAAQVAKLRDKVATVEANMKIHIQQAQEQRLLAAQFDEVLQRVAGKEGKEMEETAAASGKIAANQRATMFETLAEKEIQVLPGLQAQLDNAELDLDLKKDKASTVQATAEFGEALTQLYEINSDINPETGFTAKADLDQALIDSQRDVYKAQSLLGMANRRNTNGNASRLLLSSKIEKEIQAARQKTSLPAPESELADVAEVE